MLVSKSKHLSCLGFQGARVTGVRYYVQLLV